MGKHAATTASAPDTVAGTARAFGLLNANEKGDSLRWTFAGASLRHNAANSNEVGLAVSAQPAPSEGRLQTVSASTVVYGSTVEHKVNAEQQFTISSLYDSAEHLARKYKDLNVPNALLAEILWSEAEIQQVDKTKHVLAAAPGRSPTRAQKSSVLITAFPSGALKNQLTVFTSGGSLEATHGETRQILNTVDHRTVHTFHTPILQIEGVSTNDGLIFGVRCAKSLSLFHFGTSHRRMTAISEHKCSSLATFGPADTENCSVLAFCLCPYTYGNNRPLALLVDNSGGLWQTESSAIVRRMHKLGDLTIIDHLRRGSPNEQAFHFASIAFGSEPDTAVVALDYAVRLFHLRDPSRDATIFVLDNPADRVLDMTRVSFGEPPTTIRAILTTREIIWIDLSKAGEALLRYKHGRDKDSNLKVTTVYFDGIFHLALWSSISSRLTVFCYPMHAPILLPAPPYELDVVNRLDGVSRVSLLLVPAFDEKANREELVLLEYFEDGTLRRQSLNVGKGISTFPLPHFGSTATKKSNARPNGRVTTSQDDLRSSITVNMHKTFAAVFKADPILTTQPQQPISLLDSMSEAQDSCVRILLESQRRHDLDNEYAPGLLHHYTSEGALDAAHYSIKLYQREYSELPISRQARLRIDYTGLGLRMDGHDHPKRHARLLRKRYSMARLDERERTSSGRTFVKFASRQLALDLAVSKEGFGPVLPEPPSVQAKVTDVDMMTYNTIGDLPAIQYNFFASNKGDVATRVSPGVPALLSEWSLGADPAIRPPYQNPYRQVDPVGDPDEQLQAYRHRLAEGMEISASQPMPIRISSTSNAARVFTKGKVDKEKEKERLDRLGFGPPIPLGLAEEPPSSQLQTQIQAMPFSQVIPGVHGGRAAKRRRVGGF